MNMVYDQHVHLKWHIFVILYYYVLPEPYVYIQYGFIASVFGGSQIVFNVILGVEISFKYSKLLTF